MPSIKSTSGQFFFDVMTTHVERIKFLTLFDFIPREQRFGFKFSSTSRFQKPNTSLRSTLKTSFFQVSFTSQGGFMYDESVYLAPKTILRNNQNQNNAPCRPYKLPV